MNRYATALTLAHMSLDAAESLWEELTCGGNVDVGTKPARLTKAAVDAAVTALRAIQALYDAEQNRT